MSSYEDLAAAIRAALSTVAKSRTLTADGRAALTAATVALTGISRGSTSHQLRTALEALSASIHAAGRAENAAASVLEAMDAYVTEIGRDGSPALATSTESSPTSRIPSSTPRGPDGKTDFRALLAKLKAQGIVGLEGRTMERVPDFNPKRHNPACWQGLAPYAAVDTAQGNLFYPDGRRWNIEPIQAHLDNAAINARDLKDAYKGLRAV